MNLFVVNQIFIKPKYKFCFILFEMHDNQLNETKKKSVIGHSKIIHAHS